MGLLFNQAFWASRLNLMHSGSRLLRRHGHDRTYRSKLACQALRQLLDDPSLDADIRALAAQWRPFHHSGVGSPARASAALAVKFSEDFLHQEQALLTHLGVDASVSNRVARTIRLLSPEASSPTDRFRQKVERVRDLACGNVQERFGPIPSSKRAVRGATGVATMALNGIAAVKAVFLPPDIRSAVVSKSLEAGGSMLLAALKGRW